MDIPVSENAPSRRSTLKAAAWSVPVVAAVVAAPITSASVADDLELGLELDQRATLPVRINTFAVTVYDIAGSGQSWTGTFDFEYFVAPDDSALFLIATASPGTTSPGWTYVGFGAPGPNGSYSLKYTFSGTIPAGGVTGMTPSTTFGLNQTGALALPIATTRSAVITNVVGTPSTDTATGNSVSQPITYTVA